MSNLTPAERMAHARLAMRDQFVAEARAQLIRLGITPTDEQAEQAGIQLMRNAQRDRMATARATRWVGVADSKRAADLEWSIRHVHRYAAMLHTWAPEVSVGEQARVALMAVADELVSPDGFSRPRLIKRLDAYVNSVKEDGSARASAASPASPVS